MSESLWPHELQQAMLPCPSLSPQIYSNLSPSRWWWHLTISSSVTPFSSCFQTFPESGSFPMSQLFALVQVSSVQSLSSVRLFVTLWICSTSGLPVHHQLPERAQSHVHRVSDAIQPAHPLLNPSPLLQSFPVSGSFHMSQFFASGGQSTRVSASTSVLPMNIQDWFPLWWTGCISLQSKGLSRVFSNTTLQNINSLSLSFLYSPALTSIHDYWKNHNLDWMDLCWQSNVSAF